MAYDATYVSFPALGKVTVAAESVTSEGLGPAEVVLRTETSIISAGTELARLHGLEPDAAFPLRPGYGCIGTVLAKGEGVADVAVGDRVFYAGKHASVQRFTHLQDHQWGRLYPVPGGLDPVDAVFACMAQIAMTAPNVTELALNDTVAVFGLGLVGNLAAQLYAAAGARVIGVDPVAARGEVARRVGLGEIVAATGDRQVPELLRLTGGEGADVAVDAVGHAGVVAACVRAARRLGQVVLLGTPRVSVPGDLNPVFQEIHRRGLVVRGAHMWRLEAVPLKQVKRTVPWAFATIFAMLADGRLKVRPLASHVVRPADVPDAYRGLQEDKDRYHGVVIDWRKA